MAREVDYMLDRMRASHLRRHAIDILAGGEPLLRALPAADRDRAYHAAEAILEILPESD